MLEVIWARILTHFEKLHPLPSVLYGEVLQIKVSGISCKMIAFKDGGFSPSTLNASAGLSVPLKAISAFPLGEVTFRQYLALEGDRTLAVAWLTWLSELPWNNAEWAIPFVGDVLAERMFRLGAKLKMASQYHQESWLRSGFEFARYEKSLLVDASMLATFCHSVDELRDNVDRIAAKVQQLEMRVDKKI